MCKNRIYVLAPVLFCLLMTSLLAFKQEKAPEAGPLPLNDLGAGLYLGQYQGGLYPNGSNSMPVGHAIAGAERRNAIVPLDPGGSPAPDGYIVMLSVGMSNATWEFCGSDNLLLACLPQSFEGTAAALQGVDHEHLYLVNGAKSGQVASTWDSPQEENYDRIRDDLLLPQGLSEAQVQVVWLKNANPGPTISLPDHQADAFRLLSYYGGTMRALKVRYLNLQQVFISSRIYAGYANTPLNPEPYAYEYGLSTKWLIEAQINQMAGGDIDPIAGDLNYETAAPWVAWGPYLWADGLNPRSDGLIWEPGDYQPDGTHPSADGGVPKVRDLMLDFFQSDPLTATWFNGPGGAMGTIAGDVTLQGRMGSSGIMVRALLWNSLVTSATLGADPGYFLSFLPGSGYRLAAEAPGYLRVDLPGISVPAGGVTSLPPIQLPGGDVNDDGAIDILDLTLQGGVYGLACADPGWEAAADINADCEVDIQDLAITGSNFSRSEPVIFPMP